MTGAIILLLFSGLIFGPRAIRWYSDYQARRQFAQDIANVRLIQGPRLIASEWEGDMGVYERANTLKGILAHADNQWITPDDIVVRVYHPHADGKTALTFAAWRGMVEEEFKTTCARHYARVHASGQFDIPLHGQRMN